MATQSKTQDSITSHVKYTWKEMEQMASAWSKLAGAFGHSTTREVHEIYRKLPENQASRDLIDQYFHVRHNEKYGWRATADEIYEPDISRSIYKWLTDDLFLETLGRPERPTKFEDSGFPKTERANVLTLWFACRLMKLLPQMFRRSQLVRTPFEINRYDAVHAVCTLQLYARKMRVGSWGNSRPQTSAQAVPPSGGAFGEGGSTQNAEQDAQNDITAPASSNDGATRYSSFGIFSETERKAVVEILRKGKENYADERAMERLISNLGQINAENTELRPPREMSRAELQDLMDQVVGQHFDDHCLIYGPKEMATTPVEGDLDTTEMLSSAESIVSFWEAEPEKLTGSSARLGIKVLGESGIPIRDTDVWVDICRRMKAEQVTAESLPLETACEYAGIPLVDGNPTLRVKNEDGSKRTTELRPWQPSAIAWLMRQLESPLHGGILADACGLGKTLTALCFLYFSNRQRLAQVPPKPFRATLIVVPARVILQWIDQIDHYFGTCFKILIFWGDPDHISDPRRKQRTIRPTDFTQKLEKLSPSDHQTAFTIVITTYGTMRYRTTRLRSERNNSEPEASHEKRDRRKVDGKPRHSTMISSEARRLGELQLKLDQNSRPTGPSTEDQVNQIFDECFGDGSFGNPKQKRRLPGDYVSTCTYLWENVILDECQHVKCIRTQQHQSIALLRRNSLIGLTATPMWNTILDLLGYFSLLAGGLRAGNAMGADGTQFPSLPRPPGVACKTLRELYVAWSQVRVLPWNFSDVPYELLSPTMLAQMVSADEISAETSRDCFPFCFRASVMMRSVGDKIKRLIGPDITIGTEIPPIRTTTVEVRYESLTQEFHDELYNLLVDRLQKNQPLWFQPATTGREAEEDNLIPGRDETRRQYMRVFRRLCLLSFSPLLDRFLRAVGSHNSLSDKITHYIGAPDHGFTVLWNTTCAEIRNPRPKDAISQVYYLLSDCPRLIELLRIMDNEGAFEDPVKSPALPRFLILSHWPMVWWMVEMVLKRVGIRSVSITAAKSAEDRAAAVAEFTDPTSRCQVLNTTYNCGGTGLNLHNACHIVILVEPALNFNLEIQAIGRFHRVGQEHPQRAYRLFQDHTFCRYVTGKNIKKMIPQVAAQYPEFASRIGSTRGHPRDDLLANLYEDHVRQLMGVTEDFPNLKELLDMESTGIDDLEGEKHSNRKSQVLREYINKRAQLKRAREAKSVMDSQTQTQGENTLGVGESSKRRKIP